MSPVDLFWILIGALAFILFLLALREALLLYRLPPQHPECGIYLFNTIFLLLASGAAIWGGYYVDEGRRTLEALIPSPPSSRYAIERNGIIHDTNWIYVTHASDEAVRMFYREYAKREHVQMIEDDHDMTRMSFGLPSGDLFLTIGHEGDETVLYFSRKGEKRTVAIPAKPSREQGQ